MDTKFRELTYASPHDPRLKRWLINTIEGISGRERFLPLYRRWQTEIVPRSERVMGELLELVSVKLDIRSAMPWPPVVPRSTPLVVVANHPFGIGDGIAILALAEQLGRPFKVLINNALLRVPEIRPYALPIDFDETREAQALNLRTRKEALQALASGTTVVVFPAGGVMTARQPFGRAAELPWKLFTARMIQAARASVLPVWFDGQNGPLFHLASRISLTLRLSLLVAEFRRFAGSTITVRIGDIVPFEQFRHGGDRKLLTEELHSLVHSLADPEEEAKHRKFHNMGRKVKRKARSVKVLAKRKVKGVGRRARQTVLRRHRSTP
jgi:putative hemolysin